MQCNTVYLLSLTSNFICNKQIMRPGRNTESHRMYWENICTTDLRRLYTLVIVSHIFNVSTEERKKCLAAVHIM